MNFKLQQNYNTFADECLTELFCESFLESSNNQ